MTPQRLTEIPTVAIACFVFLLGALAGFWLAVRQLRKLYPAYRNPRIREMSFTTADGGVHWCFFGEPMPATPFTDHLQDAFEDVTVGALPGSRIQ